MKFTLILTLAASAMALHMGTPTKRDGASISSALSMVSASVAALDTQINSFSGAGNAAALQSASDAVVSAINAGTTTATASTPLSNLEAIGLVGPIQSLSAEVNTTVSDLIAKKSTFDSAGVSSTILTALQSQLTASNAFSAAVIAQLPTALQPNGQTLAQPIVDSLNAGIAAFSASPSSATSAAASMTSAAATSATTPAAPATTPAAPATTPAAPATTMPAAPPVTTPAAPMPTTPAAPMPTTPAAPMPTTPAAPPATMPGSTYEPESKTWGGWGWGGKSSSEGGWGWGWGWGKDSSTAWEGYGDHSATYSTWWDQQHVPTETESAWRSEETNWKTWRA